MRKIIFYSIILLGLITGCESTTKNLGEHFTVKNPVSLDAILTQVKTTGSAKDVQIEGKIEKSCMSEGCWFTIKDADGTEVKFDVLDKKFKVPTNSPGKTTVILADVASDTASEQKARLSVKGMMFK